MKVLLISVRADIGGGPKHLKDLLTEYKEKKIECFSAIPFAGEYFKDINDLSQESIEIPFRRFSLISLIKIILFIKKNNIKIVHSHGRGAGLYSRLLKFFGVKVIHTFHGVHIEKNIIGKIKLFIDKVLRPLTDIFICVSESEKKEAIKYSLAQSNKIVVIPNGVSVNKMNKRPNNKRLTLGTLSRLDYVKGNDILIKFIDKFISNNPNYKFNVLIAGSGDLKQSLEKLICDRKTSDNIKIIGPTNRPVDFLNSLDIYISFSRKEGMPIAVLEAMGVGLPCLISNVPGNEDLIKDDEDGLLFDLNDYNSFEHKLIKLLETREYRNKLGDMASTKVLKHYTVEKMALSTLEQYR